MTSTVRCVAFGPHPDDVELFCGGTVATLAARGHPVAIVDLTRGERATRGTTETRAREAGRAAEALGVSLRENLELPDGAVDPWGGAPTPDSPVGRCIAALRRFRPELILIPHRAARHPDHAASHALLSRAVFLAGLARIEGEQPHRVSSVACYFLRKRGTPSFVVDVSDAYEAKRRAIAAYESQVAPARDGTLVGAAGSLEALEARDRYHGSLIGAAYGEAFWTEHAVGTNDPIQLLSTPSGAPRLFWEADI